MNVLTHKSKHKYDDNNIISNINLFIVHYSIITILITLIKIHLRSVKLQTTMITTSNQIANKTLKNGKLIMLLRNNYVFCCISVHKHQ